MHLGVMTFAPDASPCSILEHLSVWAAGSEPCALVAVVAVGGRASRGPGTLMAVSAGGGQAGSISGGCFDAAVAAEAVSAMAEGRPRLLRLGAGSPWIDIRLPCGGGMDLLIVPAPDAAIVAELLRTLEARESATIVMNCEAGLIAADDGAPGWDGATFRHRIVPDLRLIVAGNGGEVAALARMARAIDLPVVVLSPERALLDALDQGIDLVELKTPGDLANVTCDARTAVAVLFHDHDWEPALLEHFLRSDALYVGAMGSRATHAERVAILQERGLDEAEIARITSPIGLFGPVRDPRSLAASALAQIVERAGGA